MSALHAALPYIGPFEPPADKTLERQVDTLAAWLLDAHERIEALEHRIVELARPRPVVCRSCGAARTDG